MGDYNIININYQKLQLNFFNFIVKLIASIIAISGNSEFYVKYKETMRFWVSNYFNFQSANDDKGFVFLSYLNQ